MREQARGFTLIELMVTLVVAGILLGTAAWQIGEILPGYRAKGAARWTLTRFRQAEAIAARTNRPVQLQIDTTGAAGCNPSLVLVSVPPAGEDPIEYDRLCLDAEYPGVALANGGVTADVSCADEAEAGLAAMPNCSLCAGAPDEATLAQIVRVLPSGETRVSALAPAGATIAFTSARNPSPRDTVAVGIRNVSGRSRIYLPSADGTSWECR